MIEGFFEILAAVTHIMLQMLCRRDPSLSFSPPLPLSKRPTISRDVKADAGSLTGQTSHY
jgi:hypothetical protein